MKNKVKKLFIVLLLLHPFIRVSAQTDLAFGSLLLTPGTIGVGQTAPLTGLINNNGIVDIPAGCVLVTISVPSSNCSITGLDPASDPIWTVFSSSLPASITLRNTGGDIVGLGPDYPIILNVLGTVVGGPFTINGNAVLNPFQVGCTALGDLDATNNQPTSGILVVAPLPIKLSSFSASLSSCKTEIKWTTELEENIKEYQIESSQDGRIFTSKGNIASLGNSSNKKLYQFTDLQPGYGINYYRLKIININGDVSYSNVVLVNSKCNGKSIKLYPNPIIEKTTPTLVLSGYKGGIRGELFSVEGKVIETYILKNGNNNLPIKSIAQGTYILKITDALTGRFESVKFVVINK